MRLVRQTTLAQAVTLSGVGLHSGEDCSVTLRPATADSGIVFRVAAGRGSTASALISATGESIADTRLCTSLGAVGGPVIATVEHVMAAASIASIDNLLIDVEGGELPILDGSAAPYLDAIGRAGSIALQSARSVIRILEPVEIKDGDRLIRAEPFDGRVIEIAIAFDVGAIGQQSLALDLNDPAALRRLGHARTFCRLSDVNAMREAGLSLGGSLDNAIVVDGDRILNPAGLRDPQEFALHKALDLLGDLALAGAPIIGRIIARRPGHDLNAQFLRSLLSRKASYERAQMTEPPAMARA
jgi:UDP-3-O-[3-hydroxymyristoyl] N-acetylglucosamine deacetylase